MTKFTDKPIWGIMSVGFGLLLSVSGSEWYHYLLALIGFASGGHNLYRYYNRKKHTTRPICNYCGYVALDARELHNHQLVCDKKINS